MSKKLLVIFSFYALFISCDNTPGEIQQDAESLCNCFRQVHKVSAEDIPIMEYLTDSCNTLWKDVYIKYKDDPTKKTNFNNAYSECQDE